MKAILISIKPKWCAKIMNGDKTIEVRRGTALYKAIKKLIDEYGYADIYVYCTKDIKNGLYWAKKWVCVNQTNCVPSIRNGKVIFKFRCYNVEEIMVAKTLCVPIRFTRELPERELCVKSCLTPYDFEDYLGDRISTAIHISDLEIFDEPKELSEFDRCVLTEDLSHDNIVYIHQRYKITKAPQSWQFVEVE